MRRPALLALLASLAAAPALAQDDPWTACGRAIAEAERGAGIPSGLLLAIARVESGRPAPGGGGAPWPFAINADGSGRFPATKQAAIAEVEALRARGIRSMDVGCMQVNLFHHPNAFADLDAAFDPPRNVAYAVRFLRDLRTRTGNWSDAVAQYHSMEPGRGLAYHSRVRIARVAGGTLLSSPAVLRGLCAPGRQAAVLVGRNGKPRIVCRR
ncbi:transglycosylase SLT domain-containing protein [Roseomonas sp. AR75]|uniref:transglycosylase SLT domain-containing protein n=1 Tax=Roseomonas sp. AR75 TaxID=2562311 RepID=UPI0014851088|nr:transglycosylase SLT domain-containing protein [Roseomonas sp. AR75]